MSMTDPIADFLSRIRNAQRARHKTVDTPASSIKKEIARILYEKGYIAKYIIIEDGKQNVIRVYLKYDEKKQSVITGIDRISKPGLRRYADTENIPKVLNGLGIAILSTSKGIITDKEAKNLMVGGEVLCYVW